METGKERRLALEAGELADLGHRNRLARAEPSQQKYSRGWVQFLSWCGENGYQPLPAEPITVAMFAVDQWNRGLVFTSVRHLMNGIRTEHERLGVIPPTSAMFVRDVLEGMRASISPSSGVRGVLREQEIRDICSRIPEDTEGVRNTAIICLGFAAGLTRSEAASLMIPDLFFSDAGVLMRILHPSYSRGGPEIVWVPASADRRTCPMITLKRWLMLVDEDVGPVFRPISQKGKILPRALSKGTINTLVKGMVEAIGLNPRDFTSRSLKTGMVISKIENEKDIESLRAKARLKSMASFTRYIGELGRQKPITL